MEPNSTWNPGFRYQIPHFRIFSGFFNLFWNFEGQNMKRGGNMFCIPTNQNICLSIDFKWCFKNRGHHTCNPATSNSSGCNAFELEHGFYFEFFSQIFCLKKLGFFELEMKVFPNKSIADSVRFALNHTENV